jgi:nucleotide-binding universal stress UspA family protein
MTIIGAANSIMLNNLLYLTDFSEASKAVVPFARAIAGQYGSKVFALHVVLPDPYVCVAPECVEPVNDGLEQAAREKMQWTELCLTSLPHQTTLERGSEVWPIVKQAVEQHDIDLILVGTHGRSGVRKLVLGSVAEQVFRCANVPVLTIGPNVKNQHFDGQFKCVLLASDLRSETSTGLAYAISIARENHARLVLLHIVQQPGTDTAHAELSKVEAKRQLEKMLPTNSNLPQPVESIVENGDPAIGIVEIARRCSADLIVLGIHRIEHVRIAAHLQRTTAHEVVCYASCPVLTVRSYSFFGPISRGISRMTCRRNARLRSEKVL